jgi:TrpR-related protein YerC/YecD
MHSDDRIHNIHKLCSALASLQTAAEYKRFLEDLCTPGELRAMADRWQVAKLIEQGIPYRTINEMTGVSTATITRVARSLSYGAGGYKQLLPKTQKEGRK